MLGKFVFISTVIMEERGSYIGIIGITTESSMRVV